MKRSVIIIASVVALCGVLVSSCQKEELHQKTAQEKVDQLQMSIGECLLYQYGPNKQLSYGTLGANLCGTLGANSSSGDLDDYMACELGPPLAGGPCCPTLTVYLTQSGTSTNWDHFEVWGKNKAGGTKAILSDATCTTGEQEDYISRVQQAAADNAPDCLNSNGIYAGAYNPVAYTFEWNYLNGVPGPDIEMAVKVTYTATCLGPI